MNDKSSLRGRSASTWRYVVRGVAVLAGLAVLLVVWGAGIEPRLIDEREETVQVPGLGSGWAGQRLAFIADLQIGMWFANTDTISRILSRVVEARPAALLIGGDFLYHPTEESGEPQEARGELEQEDLERLRKQIRDVVSLLRPVTAAGIPTLVVLGNHDYAMRKENSLPLPTIADELAEGLRAARITVLRNESVTLPAPGGDAGGSAGALYVAGLDEWAAGATDVPAALSGIPGDAPRLLLMHSPLAFKDVPAGASPVALAGHTHGGQFQMPFLPQWSWMALIGEAPDSGYGWAAAGYGNAGNRLYVNRGIGFSVVPMRFNCRPELTWLTLAAR